MRGVLATVGLTVLTLGPVGNASAGPLWPVKASQVVTLVNGAACPSLPAGRAIDTIIKPDGTTEPFAIPEKRVLVITGFQASENGNGGAIAGHSIGVALSIGGRDVVFQPVVADSSNAFAFQTTFPSGIVVSHRTPICVNAQDLSNNLNNLQVGFGAQVYGYLAPDK